MSVPVLKDEVLGRLVQLSSLAVTLKLYGCPQCRSARVQLFTEVLQLATCPSLPVAVSRQDVATGECPHVTVAPLSSHDGTTVTLSGTQGAKDNRITINISIGVCLFRSPLAAVTYLYPQVQLQISFIATLQISHSQKP